MRTSRNTDEQSNHRHTKKKILQRYMQEKLAITVVVIMLALLALIGVLYRMVRENNENYTKIVLTQRSSYDSRTIPYRRGDIVDRNGTYLATSEKVYNVIIDAGQIYSTETTEAQYLNTTVDALVQCFGYDRAELMQTLSEQRTSPYIRYERRISYDKKEEFEQLKAQINEANSKAGSKERVYGVWFEEEYKRIYPYHELADNVIGFASGDAASGTGGIEQYYNDMLIGTNGREYGYLNDESDREVVIKPARNGYQIVSTIDVNIQQMVERRIQQWMSETGSEHIGVIVMDPNNGEILAMADEKVYDLNDPRDLSSRYSQAELDAMSDEDKVTAMNQMWRNFCVSDTYEPGSPSKVLTVASALEENVVSPNSYFYCDGYQYVGGYKIKCTAYSKGGHKELSLTETVMQSCNDAMMQIAALEGKDLFTKYQSMFNIGSKTGIDLPGEASASTLVYHADNMDSSSLATNAFGQNYNCTMVQMAAAFSSAINGGNYYEPHVVKQIINESGSVISKNDGVLVRQTVSESTSRFLREALFLTVEKGTGSAAKVDGYSIGGKTGTAEKAGRNKTDYLVSFCGFAPAEDPQVLVYVVIDQPHVEDQAHSTFASGVFSQIMQDILPYLNVFPSGDVVVVTPIRPSGTDDSLAGETAQNQTQESGEQEGEQAGEEEGNGETIEDIHATQPYETEEYVPRETGDDGNPAASDLPEMLPPGAETEPSGAP